jgi:predicted nucleotidyltransferase
MSLSSILENLRNACDELRVVFGSEFKGLMLFGSWARGEARENSDVDVFVVFNTLQGIETRAKTYDIVSRHIKKPVTLVTALGTDLLRGKLTSLGINIGYDGIIVCDEENILHRFKRSVLEFIERYDLVRYRTSDGKYGWKRRDNKPLAEIIK